KSASFPPRSPRIGPAKLPLHLAGSPAVVAPRGPAAECPASCGTSSRRCGAPGATALAATGPLRLAETRAAPRERAAGAGRARQGAVAGVARLRALLAALRRRRPPGQSQPPRGRAADPAAVARRLRVRRPVGPLLAVVLASRSAPGVPPGVLQECLQECCWLLCSPLDGFRGVLAGASRAGLASVVHRCCQRWLWPNEEKEEVMTSCAPLENGIDGDRRARACPARGTLPGLPCRALGLLHARGWRECPAGGRIQEGL
ncbi:unnamed protein product, partial [Prorocentrum cordatum]